MAEWSIAAVLKTVEPRGSGGSNPSFSAKQKSEGLQINRLQAFLFFRNLIKKTAVQF